MSVCYWLECPSTHQCVHVATSSQGKPTGGSAHWVVVQLFTIAHNIVGDTLITNDPSDDSIEWDLGNCIELFERMTQETVSEDTQKVIYNAIGDGSTDYEGSTPDWLKNYAYSGRGLDFYCLGERPVSNSA